MSGGGGSSGGSSTTITKTDPPAYLQPYLTDVAAKAQTAYGSVPQGGFNGALVATPTAAQTGAVDQSLAKAAQLDLGGFGTNTANVANSLATKVLSGAYQAPANNALQPANPATQAAIDSYLQPVQQHLQEDILPQLASAAQTQGAYGGSRFATEQAKQVNDNYTQAATNIAAQVPLEMYKINQGLIPELQKSELAAATLEPTLASSSVSELLTPQQIAASAGNQEQLWAQDLLDQAYQKYVLDTQTPFAGLDQYANIINGGSMGGTSSTTGTGIRPSGGSSFLTGALGGAASGYGLSSLLGLTGPQGAIGGGILGGLLGLF